VYSSAFRPLVDDCRCFSAAIVFTGGTSTPCIWLVLALTTSFNRSPLFDLYELKNQALKASDIVY